MEVSPYLAHDTAGTLKEARRLWQAVGRENLMIKVPATREGIPAIQQLISEGININVTLLFAMDVYEKVAEAFILGLEGFAKKGGDVSRVASVASFFVSRIDTLVDGKLLSISSKRRRDPWRQQSFIAWHSGKSCHRQCQTYISALQTKSSAVPAGRRLSRPWRHYPASSLGQHRHKESRPIATCFTSRNSSAPDTVDTIPPAQLVDAFRDHGKPRASLEENVDAGPVRPCRTSPALAKLSMKEVTDQLTDEGVKLFADAFGKVSSSSGKAKQGSRRMKDQSPDLPLPERLAAAVRDSLAEWRTQGKVRKLWGRECEHPHGSTEREFDSLFTADIQVPDSGALCPSNSPVCLGDHQFLVGRNHPRGKPCFAARRSAGRGGVRILVHLDPEPCGMPQKSRARSPESSPLFRR